MVPLKSGECRAAPGTRPGSYPRPAVRARMMACARSETCNLVKCRVVTADDAGSYGRERPHRHPRRPKACPAAGIRSL